MVWVFAVGAVVLVVLIALLAIGRVSAQLSSTPATSVYDLYEATDFIADRLPDALRAKLSSEDVEQLLRWRLNHLRDHGLATLGRVDEEAELAARAAERRKRDRVAEDEAVIDHLLHLALESDRDIDEVDVVVVLDLETEYLVAIGALGPAAEA
ncbi:MAG: hypothetical protein OEU32_06020 [Acidimicrobiia bacterium]|nr:hypothetical protein [Acidimicrobiia bacterium]